MSGVELVHWNPRKPVFRGKIMRHLPLTRPVNNFGDLLGPHVVRLMLARHGVPPTAPGRDAQLLSVGSVMHLARDGAVVWGTGVNGKVSPEQHLARSLDVRAVRGPLTREFLMSRGVHVPAVYGDPALLLGVLEPALISREKRSAVTVIPNLNDRQNFTGAYLDPRSPLRDCLETIAASRLVVGSSLHGVVVAEALGVPARLVSSACELPFKYEDYYLGTGRGGYTAAGSVEEAVERGGEPPPVWSCERLMRSFPLDLWLGSPEDL